MFGCSDIHKQWHAFCLTVFSIISNTVRIFSRRCCFCFSVRL